MPSSIQPGGDTVGVFHIQTTSSDTGAAGMVKLLNNGRVMVKARQ